MDDDVLPGPLTDAALRARLAAPEGDWRSEDGLRDSAVLVVLVERGGVDHLLYNVRQGDLPSHAGQVCFPGGAREKGEDAVTCALRETREEVGLPAASLRVVARLPDRVSIAGFLVAPFVARLDGPRAYVPDAREVADVFEVPLPALCEQRRWRLRNVDDPSGRFRAIPYFDHAGYTVWGLTGIITQAFVRAAVGFDPGCAPRPSA